MGLNKEVSLVLRSTSCSKVAEQSKKFFKNEEGEYGYGDQFIGIRVPELRRVAKEYSEISLIDNSKLIKSKIHEERFCGLVILVNKYKAAKSCIHEEKIYNYYIKHFNYINNWDLVDVSCPYIIGKYLLNKERKVLYEWAKSEHLWTRRISMISNWWLIRKGDLKEVFKLSRILLNDEHDLIHKAVGWMLREAGKQDVKKMEVFLNKFYKKMPRTMLRYAIEKLPEVKRQKYLKGKI